MVQWPSQCEESAGAYYLTNTILTYVRRRWKAPVNGGSNRDRQERAKVERVEGGKAVQQKVVSGPQ